MAVNINVPSQVKTYANLAAFPATGALKTIYIAEDTNKTYRWTGSVYTEISASAAMTWGAIGGTLSNQTDLQSALDAKVPTSRTLTINGVTQDLSADRTFTISTGITIGSTAIASGSVGRVLFEGTGNVVQESANLFWDNTNSRLGIGTASPSATLHTVGSITASGAIAIGNYMQPTLVAAANNDVTVGLDIAPTFTNGAFTGVTNFGLRSSINYAGEYNGILIRNTNSTAGVGVSRFALGNNANTLLCGLNAFSSVYGSYLNNSSVLCTYPTSDLILATNFNLANSGTSSIRFFTGGYASGQQRMQIFSTGNIAINTTTDAGFRLDVNGTARVSGDLTVSSNAITVGKGVSSGIFNTVLGASPLGAAGSSTANYTIAIGRTAAFAATSGTHNVVIGTETAQLAPSIISSTLIGSEQFGRVTSAISQVLCIGTGDTVNYYPTIYATNIAGNTPSVRIGNNQSALASAPPATTASAILELSATTQGFLPPRMTTTQKNAIATPAAGLMVYDTTLNVISYYNGTMWI